MIERICGEPERCRDVYRRVKTRRRRGKMVGSRVEMVVVVVESNCNGGRRGRVDKGKEVK